jgi:hypothetical protein
LGFAAAGETQVVTASLDKSIALWALQDCTQSFFLDVDDCGDAVATVAERVRLSPEGGPIFSLVEDPKNAALGSTHHQVRRPALNRDQASCSECQVGPCVSYRFHLCGERHAQTRAPPSPSVVWRW